AVGSHSRTRCPAGRLSRKQVLNAINNQYLRNRNMENKALALEVRDRVAYLTINRPDALNAVNAELHTALSRIFIDLGERRDLNAIVLTGAGRAFCAGGDIEWMRAAVREPEQFEVVTWE